MTITLHFVVRVDAGLADQDPNNIKLQELIAATTAQLGAIYTNGYVTEFGVRKSRRRIHRRRNPGTRLGYGIRPMTAQ